MAAELNDTRPENDALPARIGTYVVRGEAGRGGVGRVLRAVDPALGRTVAIKLLLDPDAPAERVARLVREARLAARLRHPGIIAVHEVGRHDPGSGPPLHYVVMDWVEGGTLEQRLPGMDLAARVEALAQAARAVAHAHDHGVVHRDLKPANLLLDARGRVIVTDFGLARETAGDGTRLTATGALLGTPYYMAPEQVRGGTADARSDVWALGVMLYELVARRRPFEASGRAPLFAAILQHDPPPPPGPRALAAICRRALERRPALRYADAGELADELDRYRAGEPVLARPPSRLDAARRHPVRAAAVAALLLVAMWAGARWHAQSSARQAFDAAAAEARGHVDAGRWREAIAATRRALALRPDPALDRLLSRCRQETAAAAATLAAGRAERQLQRRLETLAGRIEEARAAFYAADVDLPALLAGLERELVALQPLGERPDAATAVRVELGVGWWLLGNEREAERWLDRAAARPRACYHLGLLYLRRAMTALTYHADRPDAVRQADGERLCKRALGYLEQSRSRWSGARALERDVAAVYRLLAKGDGPAIRRAARAGLTEHGAQPGSEAFHAVLAFTAPSMEAAIDHCTAGLAVRRHDPWLLEHRGARQLLIGQHRAARADLDAALRVSRWLGPAYGNRALVREELGDPAGAKADHDRAVEHDVHKAHALANRGAWHLRHQDHDAALRDTEQALALSPDYLLARYNRALIHKHRGALAAALADLDHAIAKEPRHLGAIELRSEIRLLARDPAGAKADASRAIALAPQRARTHAARGLIRCQTGDYPGALRDLDRAVELGDRALPTFSNRANARRLTGQIDGAIADYRRALAIDPKHAEAHLYCGLLIWQQGRLQAGLRHFEQAATLRPDWPDALLNRGMARLRTGDAAGALPDLERTLELAPRMPHAVMLRGLARLATGDARGALTDFDRALVQYPGHPSVLLNRARARLATGDPRGAEVDLRVVLQRRPSPEAWSVLASALERQGRTEEAAKARAQADR